MKYFEFDGNNFSYYALIGAKNEKEAFNMYKVEVDEEVKNIYNIKELKIYEAIERSHNALKGEVDNEEILKMYMECEGTQESTLLLIDGALL